MGWGSARMAMRASGDKEAKASKGVGKRPRYGESKTFTLTISNARGFSCLRGERK